LYDVFLSFKEIYEKALIEKVGLPVFKGTHEHKPPWEIGGYEVTYKPSWFVDFKARAEESQH
jgi:hypothetical protein